MNVLLYFFVVFFYLIYLGFNSDFVEGVFNVFVFSFVLSLACSYFFYGCLLIFIAVEKAGVDCGACFLFLKKFLFFYVPVGLVVALAFPEHIVSSFSFFVYFVLFLLSFSGVGFCERKLWDSRPDNLRFTFDDGVIDVKRVLFSVRECLYGSFVIVVVIVVRLFF